MQENHYFALLLEQYLNEYICYYHSKLYSKIDWDLEQRVTPSPFPISDGLIFNHLVEVNLNQDEKQWLWIHWNLHPQLDLQFIDYLSQGIKNHLTPLNFTRLETLVLIADKRLKGEAKQFIEILWPDSNIKFNVANVHDKDKSGYSFMSYINQLILDYQDDWMKSFDETNCDSSLDLSYFDES